MASLDGAPKKVLDSSDSKAVYVPPATEDDGVGWLLFVRQANLFAKRFDLARLETQGDEQPLLPDVRSNAITGRAAFTVSSNGVLVYRQGDQTQSRTLTWFERDGTKAGTPPAAPARYQEIAFLHGEQSIVAVIPDEHRSNSELWRIDLRSGGRIRLTSDAGRDSGVVISPDGAEMAWRAERDGSIQILRRPLATTSVNQPWITVGRPSHWSRNYLVFTRGGQTTDLWYVPTAGPAEPRVFLQTPAAERAGKLSPDEKWIAYESDEASRPGVYVRPFPSGDPDRVWRVSDADGGISPRWRSDGQKQELVYIAPAQRLPARVMSVAITLTNPPVIQEPRMLFPLPPGTAGPQMAMTADAQRFLVATLPAAGAVAPLTVVVNWKSLLAVHSGGR